MVKISSLTVPNKITMIALVGMAIDELISVLILEGELPPIALVFVLVLLALAALTATGRWWATGLAAGLSFVFFLFTLTGSSSYLTQPGDPAFPSAVSFLVLALAATIAGIWATVQNFQSRQSLQH